MPPSSVRKPASRAATPSWLGEPRCCSSAIAASAARECSGGGSNASSRQLTVTFSSSQGPRARTWGGALAAGCCWVDTSAAKAIERRLARVAQTRERQRRKHWGWGFEHQQVPIDQVRAGAPALAERLGV